MSIDREIKIEQQDARDLYLLVSECRSLGGDGVTWRRHLVDRLPKLLDADMAFFLDTHISDEPELLEGQVRPISVLENCSLETSHLEFLQALREGRHEYTPVEYMSGGQEGIHVFSRCDIFPDHNSWREHPAYKNYFVPRKMDEFVHTENQGPGEFVQILTIKRALGLPPFPRRIVHMLRALWIELRRYQPHELRPIADSAFMKLSKRMLQVLACLLAGHTAKEAAAQLNISTHTVQEHIKRLYKRSGASNRTELASCFRDIAPILVTMPVESIPNLRKGSSNRQINEEPNNTK